MVLAKMAPPLILLSNDDGYRSAGIATLRAALERVGEVVVCAPYLEQSAASHALSLHRPLRLVQHEPQVFSLDGTPADCVYAALYSQGRILPRLPQIVVSGLNRGLNLGCDVIYSGTVAAAREGALRNRPAVAFSADEATDIDRAASLAANLVRVLIEELADTPILLNVNFPAQGSWELQTTRLGRRQYNDEVDLRVDPRGGEYLWLGGPRGAKHHGDEDTDTGAFDRGRVSVTPLSLDLGSPADLGRTRELLASVQAESCSD